MLHFGDLSDALFDRRFKETASETAPTSDMTRSVDTDTRTVAQSVSRYHFRRHLLKAISAKLQYTDTGYGHAVQHHTTDELTTILQLGCTTNSPPTDKNLPHPNIVPCGKCLSVGGVVQHVRSRCPCLGLMPPIVIDVTVAARRPSVYVSVTLVHLAKAFGRNEMPFGRDTRVVPSNIVQVPTGREIWARNPQFVGMPNYFGPRSSSDNV